ncbi:MAG: hypothetical protein KDJ52_31555, partial [Anaerolineae bacterium]|nr:hypothetical protein [Anaerolineae bacterium]
TKNKNTFMLSGGSAYLTNEYGDLIDMRLSYDQQAKELWFSSQHSDIFQKYIGQHPQDLLSDKDAREIFLTLMSPEEFKTFRHNISTASGIYSRNHGRYIIATGMAPHSGGDPAAFFIVDTIYYQFTVGLYHDGYMRLISSMRENGELTIGGDILDEILENYNMVWDFENQKPRKKGQP